MLILISASHITITTISPHSFSWSSPHTLHQKFKTVHISTHKIYRRMNSVPLCSIVLVLLVSLIKASTPDPSTFWYVSLSLSLSQNLRIRRRTFVVTVSGRIHNPERSSICNVWQKEEDGLSRVQEKQRMKCTTRTYVRK